MKQRLILAIALCFSLPLFTYAQTDRTVSSPVSNMYLVSAKAGGVNFIEGSVFIEKNDGKKGYLLKDDSIKTGEKVSSGNNGRAEVLLNPGSFLRLGENSEFEFMSAELDDLQVKLSRGSAIFEIVTNSDDGFVVGIRTPNSKILAVESGVYRIDILGDGNTKVSVWKGKAEIQDPSLMILKAGQMVVVGKSSAEIAKFDRGNPDGLDQWSKLRAKEAMAINKKLQRDNLTQSLLASFGNNGWNTYTSFGVWVLNRRKGRWCYLPFGSWRSPYGWGYSYNIWDCPMPRWVMYTPPPPPVSQPPNPKNMGATATTKPRQIITSVDGAPTERTPQAVPRSRPVFENYPNPKSNPSGGGGEGPPIFNPSSGSGKSDSSSVPSYSPPSKADSSPSSPPIMAPVSSPKDNVKDN